MPSRSVPSVVPLACLLLVFDVPDLHADNLGGALYAGGNFAEVNDQSPVVAAGDLLALPERSAQGLLQLLPRFALGPVQVDGELWGEVIKAEHEGTEWNDEVQRLTAEYEPGAAWLLSLGTRIVHDGPAYVWNPSNPFTDPHVNNLDRAFPFHRKGDPFAAAEWLGAENGLQLQAVDWLPSDPLYGPAQDRQSSVAVRWEHIFASADVTAVLARRDRGNFASLAGSMTLSERLELHAEANVHDRRRTLLPVSRQVPLNGTSATLFELAATDENDTVGQAVVGGQYTFSNLTNVILEYLYNGEGYSDAEFDRLDDDVAAAAQSAQDPLLGGAYRGFLANVAQLSGRMRRHYLFGRVAVPHLVNELELHLFLRWGLEDNARVGGLLATLPLRGADGLRLRASVEHFSGPQDSEAAMIPYRWTGSLALSLSF